MTVSNKGCGRQYLGGHCPCPDDRCWYEEQRERERQGLPIVPPGEWLDAANGDDGCWSCAFREAGEPSDRCAQTGRPVSQDGPAPDWCPLTSPLSARRSR